MILDSSTKLEIKLAASVAANELPVHVTYLTWNKEGVTTIPHMNRTASSGTADVTILAAPAIMNTAFEPIYVSIHNADTAAATVTVKTDDGTTERTVVKKKLGADETLQYTRFNGWYIVAVV